MIMMKPDRTFIMRVEEREIAPGMVMTVRFEDDTVDKYLRGKASFAELKNLRARGGPRHPGWSVPPVTENLKKGEEGK